MRTRSQQICCPRRGPPRYFAAPGEEPGIRHADDTSNQRSGRSLSWPGLCLLAWLAILGGCRAGHTPSSGHPGARSTAASPPTRPLDSFGGSYERLALALGQRDPDSLDFSIASSDKTLAAQKQYLRLEEITRRCQVLREQIDTFRPASEAERARQHALDLQLSSMEKRIEMLRGQTLAFDEEAGRLFNTQRLPDKQQTTRARIRLRIAQSLPRKTRDGAVTGASLAQRYEDYNRRFTVPANRLSDVMRAALAACREQTIRYIPLPPGEGVELTFVRNQPWSAFSRYLGRGHSLISLNLDLPVTMDDVMELACHEGYPGHHVFNTLRESALVSGRHMPEAEVQLTFSPQSYVSEAAAAFAPRMAFSLEERVRVERDLLFPLAGLPSTEASSYVRVSALVRQLDSAEPAIAREYLDGQLEYVRAEQALASEALMAHAEATLLYMNEYRSYMLAYTDGPRRMAALVSEAAGASCGQCGVCSPGQRIKAWAVYTGLMRKFAMSLPAPRTDPLQQPASHCD